MRNRLKPNQESRLFVSGLAFCFFFALVFTFSFVHESQAVDKAPIAAEELLFTDFLNTNVISSTKQEEKLFSSPSVMYVITEEQIKQRGYTSVADILKDVPGFDIEDTHGGWVNQYWRLRGTRGVREMLLIVDGVVQNNINDFEAGRLHNFNLALVDRIEIVTGPASALYGANALLGVINVISKNPAAMNKVEISHGYTTSAGDKFGEFGKNNSTLRYANVIGKDTAFALAINRVKNNDTGKDYYDPLGAYKKGTFDSVYGPEAGPIAYDGFDSQQDDISVNLRIAKGDNLSFGVDYGDFDEGIGAMISSARYITHKDAKWHTRRLSSFMKMELAATDTLKVTPIIYHKADQIVNDSGFSNTVTRGGYPPGTIRYYKQQASRAGMGLDLSYIPIRSLSLLGGIVYESDVTENEVRKYAIKMDNDNNIVEEVSIGTSSYIDRMPVFYRKLYSAYAQCIYEFTSEFKGIGGGRYEKDTFNRGEFIPRLGIVWDKKLANERELISKLLWGKSYRALANYERYDVYNLGAFRTQPIDLSATNPERASTLECQTIYLPNKRVKYDATAWYTRITDKILDGTEGYTIVNGEADDSVKETTYGAIIGADVQLKQNLLWGINYTFTAGKNEGVYFKNADMGVPDEIRYEKLLQIAPHKINSHINYSYTEYLNMNLGINFVGERNADPQDRLYGYGTAAHGTAPSYTTVDLNICSRFVKIKGLTAGIFISNLFNEKYVQLARAQSDYVAYYEPQPGRRVMVTLKWMM